MPSSELPNKQGLHTHLFALFADVADAKVEPLDVALGVDVVAKAKVVLLLDRSNPARQHARQSRELLVPNAKHLAQVTRFKVTVERERALSVACFTRPAVVVDELWEGGEGGGGRETQKR